MQGILVSLHYNIQRQKMITIAYFRKTRLLLDNRAILALVTLICLNLHDLLQ